ncbi:hypothetical protein MGSAQ_000956 [marine sediment metagenome]|uniref:Uncharacterized protein n=1 Tax=marine sediment metagenome TaxID=412755 RepID=A0A1B6NXS0_9ZZZZ
MLVTIPHGTPLLSRSASTASRLSNKQLSTQISAS